MTRVLAVLLTAGLLLASSAHAKGPHAILTPGDDPAEAGRPWRVTLELMEFGHASKVKLVARQGEVETVAKLRPARSDFQEVRRYDVTLTFPSDGRWTLLALSGKRRFNFDALAVGSGRVPPPYVAFAVGSRAEREGAGGVYYSSGEPTPADGAESLPPEEFALAGEEADEGGGVPLWLFPLAGVVLAGAGLLTRRLR